MKTQTVRNETELQIPGITLMGYYSSQTANNPLALHVHEDCIEITFVVKGNIKFTTAEAENVFSLYGGDTFITPANLPHGTGNNPVGICELYWVQLNIADNPFLFLGETWAKELKNGLAAQKTRLLRQGVSTRSEPEQMFKYITSKDEHRRFQGISSLIQMLHEIIDTPVETSEDFFYDIHSVTNWIFEHINEDIRLEDLAGAANMSLSHFKQKFYKNTGMSPRAFINMQKIEHAKELLLSGMPVNKVSDQLGFNSNNYFSTVFKKYTTMTPSDFQVNGSAKT